MKHDYKQALEQLINVEAVYVLATSNLDRQSIADQVDKLNPIFESIRSALELAIALQPKPISEAPRDGTPILAYSKTRGLESPVQWGRYERFDLNGYSGAISDYVYYYDLSALPKVEEVND